MFESGLFSLGIFTILVGLTFFLVTFLVLRAVPKIHPISSSEKKPPILPDLPAHSEAVLMIKNGGRVSYLNDEARDWFNLWDEEPNLERMARQTRPADASDGPGRMAGLWVPAGHTEIL